MAEAFYLAGLAANACVGAQDVTVSSEDTNHPKTRLFNGFPSKAFRFGSLDVDPTIDFDLNMIPDGNFETDDNGATPSVWKVGNGTPVISTAQKNEGSKSIKLETADDEAHIDVEVVPGNTYRFTCALYGDGTDPINVYVIDPLSGKYLNGSAAWVTTKTVYASKSATGFSGATDTDTFTVEDSLLGFVGPARLRISIERPSSVTGAAYADSIYLWPRISFAALVYHTVPTSMAVSIESSTDSAFTTTSARGTLPSRPFKSYVAFDALGTPQRYVRFQITGTPIERPFVGQPVLGERKIMAFNPDITHLLAREMEQVGTEVQPVNLSDMARYAFQGTWGADDDGMNEAVDKMLGGCLYGQEPLLIVPDSTNPIFVYGRGASLKRFAAQRQALDSVTYSLSFVDDRFPVRIRA